MRWTPGIRFYAVCASILLSVWSISQDRVVNDDGILYLLAADLISAGDWDKALSLFNWLFYPAAISLLDRTTGIGLEHAAHVLNTCLLALLVYAFISIGRETGAARRTLAVFALVILIYPNLNEYRGDILRDFGYWAFYLTSVLYFLRYARNPALHTAWLWAGTVFIAFLFRIEAVVLYLMLPILFAGSGRLPARERLAHVTRLYSPLLLTAVLLAAVAFIFRDRVAVMLGDWDKPAQMLNLLLHALQQGLAGKAEILREHFLVKFSEDYAWSILIASLVIILAAEVIKGVGIVFSALALYALYRKVAFDSDRTKRLWYILLAINLAVLALFVVTQGFLVGRYLIALTLTVMLATPPAIVALYKNRRQGDAGTWRWRHILFPALALGLVYMALDGVVSTGPDKDYLVQAGKWLRHNTAGADRLFSNDAALLHLAGKLDFESYSLFDMPEAERFDSSKPLKERRLIDSLGDGNWRRYDYLALRIKRKHPQDEADALAITGCSPLQAFANARGDKVLIFRLDARAGE